MIFFQVLYSDTAPLIRHSQIPPLDSSDSESEIEPQPSGDEHPDSDDSNSALAIIVTSLGDDMEVQCSTQSSSEQFSIAPTLVVSPSADATGEQSSRQPSEEGDQSIARRTISQLARRSHDPLPTPQLSNENSLTGSQYRQRAPLKHSRRCLENHTRNDSCMSETLDE